MKHIYIAAFFSFLIYSSSINAQQFRWLTGGGSDIALTNGIVQGEWITDMCTDDNGNVYSLAQVGDRNIKADTFFQDAFSSRSADWNILFMSHDCNGKMRFAKLIESRETNYCQGIEYHAGKIYVAGVLYDTGKRIGYDAKLTGKHEYSFTSKFDTSGTYEWTKFIGPDSISTLYSSMAYGSLAIDGQGNIHRFSTMRAGLKITPSITSQWGTYDIKYDPNGNLLSVNKLQDIDSGYSILKARIDKSTNKSYVLFGLIGGTTTRSYNALVAYNPNGTMIWKDTTNPRSGIGSFRVISGNGLYFIGQFSQQWPFSLKGMTLNNSLSSTGYVAVIGKLDITTGNPIWLRQIDGQNGVNFLYDLEVLSDYSITALGHYSGYKKYRNDTISSPMGSNYRPMVFAIDSSGALIDWEVMYGTDFYNYGRAMTADKKGNVYLGGEVALGIKAGKLAQYNKNGGNSDFFISKFGYDCSCTGLATPASNFTYTITDSIKRELQFTFTGVAQHDSVVWRFGDGSVLTANNPKYTFSDTGLYTVCAKVMVPCGRKVFCKDIYIPYKDTSNSIMTVNAFESVRIYPNPANEALFIDGLETTTTIELYDIVGRRVHSTVSENQKEHINISSLPQGNYIITLTNSEGSRMMGKVVKR